MKKFRLYLGIISILVLLFTSCSKDEQSNLNDSQKASLSFAPLLNNMMAKKAALKQSLEDLPKCSDGTPAYVEVVLSQGGTQVVGTTDNPLRVDVNSNPGDYDNDGTDEYFTKESSSLELEPGTYTLEYFKVYDSDGQLIWIAPRTGDGTFASYVNSPLPLDISLGAGVKKYVDVDVLCYDQRMVNLYGYLFFDIEQTQIINFCVFGNYCDDNGRHFPAHFSVDVWKYSDGSIGNQLYSGLENSVTLDQNGDYSGSTVCVNLPDGSGTDEYYFEITLMDSDAYGDVDNTVIRSGVITDAQVRELFTGEDAVDYYHFREGNCNLEDSPMMFDEGEGGEPSGCDLNDPEADCDNDGVKNGDDECNEPVLEGQTDPDGNGCWTYPDTEDCIYDDVCDIPAIDFPCLTLFAAGETNLFYTTGESGEFWFFKQDDPNVTLGTATVSYDDNDHLEITIAPSEDFGLSGYVIEVIPALDNGNMSTTCREFACEESADGYSTETFTTVTKGMGFYIKIKAVICPPVIPN